MWLSATHFGAHPKVVELLLEKGADVNATDRFGTTPLVNSWSTDVIQMLLDRRRRHKRHQ